MQQSVDESLESQVHVSGLHTCICGWDSGQVACMYTGAAHLIRARLGPQRQRHVTSGWLSQLQHPLVCSPPLLSLSNYMHMHQDLPQCRGRSSPGHHGEGLLYVITDVVEENKLYKAGLIFCSLYLCKLVTF